MAKLTEFKKFHAVEIDATASWSNGVLTLAFVVKGDLALLRFPDAGAKAERRDELWKHTCFEAFLQPFDAENRDAYFEINLSPAGDWNVYAFDRYRQGMRPEKRIPQLKKFAFSAQGLEARLECALDLTPLQLPSGFRLGLCAVIESTQGEKSYWALTHPADQPDFHNAKGFSLELAASPVRN